MQGYFYGIGVGPGDPELLTVKAINTLKKIDAVIAPKTEKKEGSVALSIVKVCSCGLSVFRQSLCWRNTGFGKHCAIGIWGIVNHRLRVQPMHHSVLSEEGSIES